MTTDLQKHQPAELVRGLDALAGHIAGEVRDDALHRMLYAQDASVYQEQPLGVVFPRDRADVQAVVRFAHQFGVALIPRAAGTSLAGQCVGPGLVVDLGRHMNQILELNAEEGWVRVQPGVILDDLNRFLAPHGLFFGPDTSTSNRCMIGGMIGNNSCGSHSIYYGTTRDHLVELGVVLADGSYAEVGDWTDDEWRARMQGDDLLARGLAALDRQVREHADEIRERYPRPDVVRRNTGYPFDDVLDRSPYTDGGQPFSLQRFLCGTEGTLAMTVEAKLNVVRKPTTNLLVCAHFDDLYDALEATVLAVQHEPAAVELIDRRVLDQTKENLEQQRNRFFIEGDPDAILVVELYGESQEALETRAEAVIADFAQRGYGYAYPLVRPPKDKHVWALRKAGLGLLMGIAGDVKPVTVVEDTAVSVQVLPEYIREFSELMEAYGTRCVYYAHASVGELHLRPELNLKDPVDADKFVGIAEDVTDLVRKFGGSLSGEHGDGRLRGPLLERFYGRDILAMHARLKDAFDPGRIFNPHKVIEPHDIRDDWRFVPGQPTAEVDTVFDWSSDGGLVRAVEKCNGAGVCRKRAEAGGTMCPSYMATLDERDTTRGRANVFRQVLHSPDPRQAFVSEDLKAALDLCLMCKGCKSECPANVDMARMKAEFLQGWHDRKGTPLSARLFGNYERLSRLAAKLPRLSNFMLEWAPSRWVMRQAANIATERRLPAYAERTFQKQFADWRRDHPVDQATEDGRVWLYVDPFTEYTEPGLAMAAVEVLEAAGLVVERLPIDDDGRTMLSKGLLERAKALTEANMRRLEPLLDAHPHRPVIGLEPSALLTFRDEAPDLATGTRRTVAQALAERAYLFDEYVAEHPERFDGLFDASADQPVILHGHCHQKAIVGLGPTVAALELAGYRVEALPTGCCGMAGSFGYEADHYEVSMAVGELVLFPALRQADADRLVCAPGTSCRHQIADGVDRRAEHTAVLLARALR